MISLMKYRKSHRMSRQQLADKCGCSASLIGRLELGATWFSRLDERMQKRIADALGSPVEAFYHDSELNIYTSCKTYKMPLDKLEAMLHEKYGDRIGKPKGSIKKAKSRNPNGRQTSSASCIEKG